MEKLLVIAVFLTISAISQWLKKRSGDNGEIPEIDPFPKPSRPKPQVAPPPQQRQPPPPLTSPRPAAKPAGQPVDWQAELRKMLEEKSGRTTGTGTGLPPVTAQRLPGTPMAKPRSAPAPPPPEVRNPLQTARPGPLAKFKESSVAYERASALPAGVGKRLVSVGQMVEQSKAEAPKGRQAVSAELRQAVAMARRPRGARQAMALSVIFGTPKALRE